MRFAVHDGHVAFVDPSSEASLVGPEPGQAGGVYDLQAVADDVERRVGWLSGRLPEEIGRVERHPDVLHNAWVVAATRIPTSIIYELHLAGYRTADILGEYPRLTQADVRAAIAHEEGQREVLQAG